MAHLGSLRFVQMAISAKPGGTLHAPLCAPLMFLVNERAQIAPPGDFCHFF